MARISPKNTKKVGCRGARSSLENTKKVANNHGAKPLPNDIVGGRGKGPQGHVGNIQLHRILSSILIRYKATPMKGGKTKIVKEILQQVKAEGGRFVYVDNDVLHEHCDEQAHEIISKKMQYHLDKYEKGDDLVRASYLLASTASTLEQKDSNNISDQNTSVSTAVPSIGRSSMTNISEQNAAASTLVQLSNTPDASRINDQNHLVDNMATSITNEARDRNAYFHRLLSYLSGAVGTSTLFDNRNELNCIGNTNTPSTGLAQSYHNYLNAFSSEPLIQQHGFDYLQFTPLPYIAYVRGSLPSDTVGNPYFPTTYYGNTSHQTNLSRIAFGDNTILLQQLQQPPLPAPSVIALYRPPPLPPQTIAMDQSDIPHIHCNTVHTIKDTFSISDRTDYNTYGRVQIVSPDITNYNCNANNRAFPI